MCCLGWSVRLMREVAGGRPELCEGRYEGLSAARAEVRMRSVLQRTPTLTRRSCAFVRGTPKSEKKINDLKWSER